MAKENPSGLQVHNVLAAGTVIIGNISSPNDIRIDGKVEGNIACDGKVVVGQMGAIVGNIEAGNAEIMGTVTGNLTVSETLSLKATACFEGEIRTRILAIEPNAAFNGKCTVVQS